MALMMSSGEKGCFVFAVSGRYAAVREAAQGFGHVSRCCHCIVPSLCTCRRYVLPLSELGGDFYDELKSISSGYASFDYEEADYRQALASLFFISFHFIILL